MAIIKCFRCGATSECGEVENGNYQWTYGDEMMQRCQEMRARRQAGETKISDCSEIDKAARAFIDEDIADKSVQAAKNILAKAMHPTLAKDHAALAKAIQKSSRQRTRKKQQWDRDTGFKLNYASRITLSSTWFTEANKLLAAAEFLEPHILERWKKIEAAIPWETVNVPEQQFQSTYMMLCAYAIENFCKGWLAAQLPAWERERLKKQGKLPKSLEGHDLFALVKKIGLPFIDHDEELLRRLAQSAVWRGRYPVSLHYRGGEEQFEDGKTYDLGILGAGDIPRIKELVQRLRQHVNAPTTYRVPRYQKEKEKKSDESE